MSINKRVVKLIEKTTGSKTGFSKTTGISNVILSHISSGRNKVSLTAVEQILTAYPNVNADWLVLGKGNIFKEGLDKSKEIELLSIIEELTKQSEVSNRLLESYINKLKIKISE